MKHADVKEIILYGILLCFSTGWYNVSKQLFAWRWLLVEV
jgi:hypothetical protein